MLVPSGALCSRMPTQPPGIASAVTTFATRAHGNCRGGVRVRPSVGDGASQGDRIRRVSRLTWVSSVEGGQPAVPGGPPLVR